MYTHIHILEDTKIAKNSLVDGQAILFTFMVFLLKGKTDLL